MRPVRLVALLVAILLVAGFSSSISALGADPGPAADPCPPGTPQCVPVTGPLIQISKTASPASLPAGGGPVTYTYKVTNGGSVPLSGVTVTDNKCAPVTFVSGDTNGNTLLDVTETWLYTCTTNVTVTTTNTATAQGLSSSGLGTGATASATVTVAGCPPATANCPTPTPTPCPPGGTSPNCPTPTPTPCPPGTTNCPPLTAKLCATKFNDLNGNGSKAVAEPFLGGVTMTIVPAVAPGPQVTPAATGQVCWTVAAGVYTITESGPGTTSGWVPTTPTLAPSKSQTVAIAAGGSLDIKFGNHKFLIDHFECYTIAPTGLVAPFAGILLKDQFASRTLSVIRRTSLCTPTRKTVAGTNVTVPITNARAHLVCYVPTTQPQLPAPNTVRVSNQFGNTNLRVLQPTSLCLPSSKSRTTAYLAIPTTLSHYLCYAVKDLTPHTYPTVVLTDQFGVRTTRVLVPTALCVPVRKTYQGVSKGVLNATDHLVCYTLPTTTSQPKPVRIKNQFEQIPLEVMNPIRLCVPSLKKVLTAAANP